MTLLKILYLKYIFIYKCDLVHEMLKSARYYKADRADNVVFHLERLPQQPVSSRRNLQGAENFLKMGCLNVYDQTIHAFLPLLSLLTIGISCGNCYHFRPKKYSDKK